MAQPPVIKRKRVTQACENCRSLKAKCDGVQPICGRCKGYDHVCHWGQRLPRGQAKCRTSFNILSTSDEVKKLQSTLHAYDGLLKGMCLQLCEKDRKFLELGLSTIPDHTSTYNESLSRHDLYSPESDQEIDKSAESLQFPRFHGEASDIRFLHAMKSVICESSTSHEFAQTNNASQAISYEQEEATQESAAGQSQAFLPSKETADRYIDIFFSTIHIAYPFIWRASFVDKYEKFWQFESAATFRGPWLSLLLTIFAIGACYETLSGLNKQIVVGPSHQQFFSQAQRISQQDRASRTIEYVCALMGQCFYLLATSQTDRCWDTLGLAIRIAQSIGLHVEDKVRSSDAVSSVIHTRRSVWYSLYILDRLLSLQLGRPPAIQYGQFNIPLPSTMTSAATISGHHDLTQDVNVLAGEYFVAMIDFSHVIGQVLNGLYSPSRSDSTEDILSTINTLDGQLVQWKNNLSRILRFDLSHTFESSITLKRQRTFLAIKFYNLRALIHRPFLVPTHSSFITGNQSQILGFRDPRILRSKKICISAAQHTARLLHNIEDKQTLVFGFPWWQMISCLTCASSILLVASICVDDQLEGEQIDWTELDEDAKVCSTVFQALSTNSAAARVACDMLQGLKDTRIQTRGLSKLPTATTHQPQVVQAPLTFDNMIDGATTDYFDMHPDLELRQMINEISEPILWSAQFVNAEYNPLLALSTGEPH